MLGGEYRHNIDDKGRLNFPAKLREALGEKLVLTRGLDNCVFVYSPDEWELLAQKIKELPLSKGRMIQRFFSAGYTELEPDKQGRILVPPSLRKYAKLDKDITVIGAINRAEIWDTAEWEKAQELELDSDKIAAVMDEIAF